MSSKSSALRNKIYFFKQDSLNYIAWTTALHHPHFLRLKEMLIWILEFSSGLGCCGLGRRRWGFGGRRKARPGTVTGRDKYQVGPIQRFKPTLLSILAVFFFPVRNNQFSFGKVPLQLQNQSQRTTNNPTRNQIRHVQSHFLRVGDSLIIVPHPRQRNLRFPLPEIPHMAPGRDQGDNIQSSNEGANIWGYWESEDRGKDEECGACEGWEYL